MGFSLRYKLENLAHYGKQGTERLSEYRGYSHGLKRGWIVSLTSYGSLSAFCVLVSWMLELCAGTLITENRLPAFLVVVYDNVSKLPFPSFMISLEIKRHLSSSPSDVELISLSSCPNSRAFFVLGQRMTVNLCS